MICEATLSRRRLTLQGFERIPCTQTVGIASFEDREGITRYHCAIEGHRYDVERRFGVADPSEPEWDEVGFFKWDRDRREVAPETESELAYGR